MSRSASLCINLILTGLEVSGLELEEEFDIINFSQAVENDYTGSPCGQLDQIMIYYAKEGMGTHYNPADNSIKCVLYLARCTCALYTNNCLMLLRACRSSRPPKSEKYHAAGTCRSEQTLLTGASLPLTLGPPATVWKILRTILAPSSVLSSQRRSVCHSPKSRIRPRTTRSSPSKCFLHCGHCSTRLLNKA